MEGTSRHKNSSTLALPGRLKAVRAIPAMIFLACSSALLSPGALAVNIIFSAGEPGVSQYLSDGTTEIPTDAGFFFELGTFADGFVPTDENTEEWLDHWVLVNDSQGAPLPESQTELTVVSSIFPDYSGFSSSVELEHNNAPFTFGTQGYVWGYNNRTEPGDSEWILLTNSETWKFPDSSNQQATTQAWSVGTSNEAIVGSVSGASMTLGSVSLPSPPVVVPEPSSASLLALGTIALLAARRRRPARPC